MNTNSEEDPPIIIKIIEWKFDIVLPAKIDKHKRYGRVCFYKIRKRKFIVNFRFYTADYAVGMNGRQIKLI